MTTAGPSAADDPVVRLERWTGPWSDDDPDANFKAEVALWSKADPLEAVRPFAEAMGMPVGAVVRYVLCRWAGEGSTALLELGPRMVERLWEPVAEAEAAGTDEARLAAYARLRDMVSWLRLPIA